MNDALYSVEDRVVIVTGGTGLLGSVYSNGFAERGASVVICDVASRRPQERAAEIEAKFGRPALGIECDVGDEQQVREAARRVWERFSRLDVVINNAAFTTEMLRTVPNQRRSFEEYPLASWEAMLKTNLTGPFLVCRELGPYMKRTGRASVINVSSTYGLAAPHHEIYEDLPFNTVVTYSTTKAGILGLTRWLASYWAKDGIRVNAVTPGGVYNDHDPEFVRRYSLHTPLGRMADRQELLGIMVFLASDASSYCTGQNFVVDGGWTAW